MKKLIFVLILMFVVSIVCAEEVVNIEQFIGVATHNNPEFEEILIDELKIKYNKLIGMDNEDLLMNVKTDYSVGELDNVEIALSKLFLNTGSTISAGYAYNLGDGEKKAANLAFTQNLIKNAFGREDKVKFERIDKNDELLRYQIVEAYEKYIYELLNLYYSWSLAYLNLQQAVRNYNDSMTLYDNMQDKKKSNIITKSDLGQSYIQTILKKESVDSATTEYRKYLNQIKQAMRVKTDKEILPSVNLEIPQFNIDFLKIYENFKRASRTYRLFEITNDISLLDLKIVQEGLADSLDLTLNLADETYFKNSLSGSLTYSKRFFDMKSDATEKVQEISRDKSLIEISNDKYDVETQLLNLYEDIELTSQLIKTTEDKIVQAETVMTEDQKYYQQGRLSFSNYVDSINRFEQYKYERISRILSLRMLLLKWKEVTDTLIKKDDVLKS
jgi:hypothetical protein